jgi:FixJ family two-component response regulator
MDLRPFLVAVVDDDPHVLESFDELLGSAGYQVLLFSSASAFLEGDGIQRVDCLISDIRMPSMSGWELLRMAHSERPGLPVILMTARDQEHSRDQVERSWARFLFRKPFDSRELVRAVDRLLREGQQSSDLKGES